VAVAGVPSGSVLTVRAAVYPKTALNGKALTISCDAGVTAKAAADWYLESSSARMARTVHWVHWVHWATTQSVRWTVMLPIVSSPSDATWIR
jgi:hypothetical protein